MASQLIGKVVGPPGADGQDGQDGTSAVITGATATASGLTPGSTPTVTVTAGGTSSSRSFAFAFGIPAGAKGDPGDDGQDGQDGPNRVTSETATTLTGILKGNGSTVTTATAGTDYGTYSKPAGGIPTSDLASVDSSPTSDSTNPVQSGGVYTALSAKAPTASPALTGTPTAPTAAAGTNTAQIATTAFVQDGLTRRVNRNILDNWYFVGGGSQQGGGQFPINQRGQTSYTGSAYGIDRWNGEVGYSIVTVSAGGVNVKTSSAGHNGGIVQNINNPTSLLGKEITASVLYDNTFLSSTVTVPSSFSTRTFAATAPYQLGMTSGGVIYIRLKDATTTGKTYKAVKIELGSTQTLCHNEGTTESPVWVLNEIPNFQQELAKCQRYFWNSGASLSKVIAFVGVRGDATAGTTMVALINTPVPMRAEPTIDATLHSIRGNGAIWNTNLSSSATPSMWSDNIVYVPATCSTASFPAYTSGYIVLFSKLTLSAEL